MRVHNKKSLLKFRRNLRIRDTPAENIFWQHVRSGKLNGLKFKRQHSIGNYIVDFYCASEMLIIELDGSIHNSKEQKEKDQLRDENLREINFKILRFKNQEILTAIDHVKQRIINNLHSPPIK
jgi:very-short-patch-repair endonuclease